MDAKPTTPPKTTGSMANIHDRATSMIIGAIEPNPGLTGRPWGGGAGYAPGAARFDDGARALSQDEMRRAAPSIFAARPHASRSQRFRAIPTIEVLRGGLSARAPATMGQQGHWRRGRLVTTRAINNIDQDIKLNKALWVLGERMAGLLGLAA
jgi:hypothetical protein